MREEELQELRCPRAAHQPRAGEGLWEDEGRGCDGAPWGSWEHLGGVHTVGAFVFLLLELGGLGWAHLMRLWVLLGVTLQPLGFPSSLSLMFLLFFLCRSGGPSDNHYYSVPHHGHSCSDNNSCLKKLVRPLGGELRWGGAAGWGGQGRGLQHREPSLLGAHSSQDWL